MSGGIDSALTAAVAVDALGPDRVRCVMMPSPYTSQESLDDAAEAARLLGVRPRLGLDRAAMSVRRNAGRGVGRHRCRHHGREHPGTVARTDAEALSNKTGAMVVSTGNKSEMSVGYATLCNDMCGGYSVLKDVYKTKVFELCRWRNDNLPTGALGPGRRRRTREHHRKAADRRAEARGRRTRTRFRLMTTSTRS